MLGRSVRSVLSFAALSLLAACGSQEAGTAPAAAAEHSRAGQPGREAAPQVIPASASATQEAAQIFSTRCTPCHGSEGMGDGPASAGLTPRPRNLRDAAWQSSVSDAHIEQIIQYGGAAVGKSPAMPSNPDLMSKPELVTALRAHVRGLGQP